MEGAPPTVRFVGRYALYDKIASGGMAAVHYGRLLGPAGFARTVAIKCLYPQFASDPEFVTMFLDEARLAARIRSPYVVPTIDVVAIGGELLLVMEYVPGQPLVRLIRPSPGLTQSVPVEIAVAIMSDVLEGLHAAHEAQSEQGTPLGIVHRDVSPQNIIVGTDGLGHVIDFGVAKAVGRLQTTREGQLKGKLAYMAPEQLRSDPVTRRTDVYAATVVLWEALTGERLFQAADEGGLVTRVLMGAVVPPSKAAAGRDRDAATMASIERLDKIVMRGLDRTPARRFETAREMAVALQKEVSPANPAAVREWLEQTARSSLVRRAARVTEIESSVMNAPQASDPGSHAPSSNRGTGGSRPSALSADAPLPRDVEHDDADVPIQPATQASSISVVSSVGTPVRHRRALWLIPALVVILSAMIFATRSLPRGASTAAQASVLPGAPTAVGAPVPPQASESVSDTPPIPSSPPSIAPVPPPVAAASASATPATPIRKWTSGPRSDCNPPFTWDAQGKKHYKANCL